jgi:hypothetical protein
VIRPTLPQHALWPGIHGSVSHIGFGIGWRYVKQVEIVGDARVVGSRLGQGQVGGDVMGLQSVSQAAQRSALDAQAVLRKEHGPTGKPA